MVRLVVFLLFFAAVLYALFWLADQRAARSGSGRFGRPGEPGGGPGGRPAPRGPRGPLGPDDDEEFLRQLDREQRRHRQQHGSDDEL